MATLATRIGNLADDLLNKSEEQRIVRYSNRTGKQTCLEAFGIIARKEHLMRNEWRRNDIEYTKQLVSAEYAIQSEFKVGPDSDEIESEIQASVKKQEENKIKSKEKAEKKKKKKEEKANKKANTVKGVEEQPGGDNSKSEPFETTLTEEDYNFLAMMQDKINNGTFM